MEIVIKNPEEGMQLAAATGNQLIAEILYQMIMREPEANRYKIYGQVVKYIEELNKNQVNNSNN